MTSFRGILAERGIISTASAQEQQEFLESITLFMESSTTVIMNTQERVSELEKKTSKEWIQVTLPNGIKIPVRTSRIAYIEPQAEHLSNSNGKTILVFSGLVDDRIFVMETVEEMSVLLGIVQ